MYPLLDSLKSREDLCRLDDKEMPALAEEIRSFLVERVSENGGHLASNLGVVELSIALHRHFDPFKDHIIFDTGHQCYVHKLLTNRKDAFSSLRTPGGLSGFPSRKESVADAFGTGHSGTALSAALGFAEADYLSGSDAFTVAVIGDGAYTSGMVHEALNNVRKDRRLIVILNENEMSISKNRGRFAGYLAKIRTSRRYFTAKRTTVKMLRKIPVFGEGLVSVMRKIKQKMKNGLYNSTYFEELGLFYMGPIDGNNFATVSVAIEEAKKQDESVLIHVKTVKGKGYAPAEAEPSRYHSLPPAGKSAESSFHSVFGEELSALAKENSAIVAVTAAMEEGTGLHGFRDAFPDRFFDVGIAEEHALTFAAGLAANGVVPFFAVYSTFLQRGYDNILHDVALQELPVKLAVDRAGLAANDGPTHHGIFDVALLSQAPGMEIFTPATYGSFRVILRDMTTSPLPQAVRYPNSAESAEIDRLFYPNGDYKRYGVRRLSAKKAPDVLLVAYGTSVLFAVEAREKLLVEGIDADVLLIEKLAPYAPLADCLIREIGETPVIFIEEGIYNGGAGMILSAALREKGLTSPFRVHAIRDSFAAADTPVSLHRFCHISASDLVDSAHELLKEKCK